MDVGANGSFRHFTGDVPDTGMMVGNIKHAETVVCCRLNLAVLPFSSSYCQFLILLFCLCLTLCCLFHHFRSTGCPLKAKICSKVSAF